MSGRFDFFDPAAARGPRPGPDVVRPPTPGQPAPVAPLTVSGLIARIRTALATAFPQRLAVVGELSNVKRHDSGHLYFRLKDANAAIDAVMFRREAAALKFTPTDGLEVVAEGRVDVYDPRGQLQLYVEQLTPKGAGALELAFRQLREKLQAAGLFDPARKKPIPAFPRAIGVVTSPTGAAIRDIHRTLSRRWPAARIYLYPTVVQGDAAAPSVAAAIAALDAAAAGFQIDTIIVARGGGSLEDLWAFNEEVVARAIFAAHTPIITGVGHETDITIADLVADARAATPTAAAELAVPNRLQVAAHLDQFAKRLSRCLIQRLGDCSRLLAAIQRSVVFRDPNSRVRSQIQRLDELGHRLNSCMRARLGQAHRGMEGPMHRLARLHPLRLTQRAWAILDRLGARLAWGAGGRSKRAGDALGGAAARLAAVHPVHRTNLARQHVEALARQLDSLSYRNVLGRGFSVTRRHDGVIIRQPSQVQPGEQILTELAAGAIHSQVTAPGAAPPAATPRKRSRRQDAQDQPTLFDSTDEVRNG